MSLPPPEESRHPGGDAERRLHRIVQETSAARQSPRARRTKRPHVHRLPRQPSHEQASRGSSTVGKAEIPQLCAKVPCDGSDAVRRERPRRRARSQDAGRARLHRCHGRHNILAPRDPKSLVAARQHFGASARRATLPQAQREIRAAGGPISEFRRQLPQNGFARRSHRSRQLRELPRRTRHPALVRPPVARVEGEPRDNLRHERLPPEGQREVRPRPASTTGTGQRPPPLQ